MHLLLSLAMTTAWPVEGARLDALYRFPVGTVWRYEASAPGERASVVLTVTGVSARRVVAELRDLTPRPQRRGSEALVWSRESGGLVLTVGKGADGRWPLLQDGAATGTAWTLAPDTAAPCGLYLGRETVVVPAGTYRDAVHVRVAPPGAAIDVWLVPGVGLVRLDAREGDRVFTLRLTGRGESSREAAAR